MVYLILAAMVLLIITAVNMVKAKPMPRDMEEAEAWLDRKIQEERRARQPVLVTVLIVPMEPTPDRPVDLWMEQRRKEINQMMGEA